MPLCTRLRRSIRWTSRLLSRLARLTGAYVDALELSSQRQGAVTIVAARGDLDIITSPQLDSCLTEARRATAQVILDLSAVDFMDTSCLAVIVGHWKKLTTRGGMLALAGARYRYTKTLWITGLAERLPMFDDVPAALAACSADGAAQPGAATPGSAHDTAEAAPPAGTPSGSGPDGSVPTDPAAPASAGPPASGPAGRPAGRPPGRTTRPR
jgi:anti-sigma B factor antagonist